MTNNIIEIDFKMVEVKPYYYLLAGNLRVGIICLWPLLNLIGILYFSSVLEIYFSFSLYSMDSGDHRDNKHCPLEFSLRV